MRTQIKVRPRKQSHDPDQGQEINEVESTIQDLQAGLLVDIAAARTKNPVQDPIHVIENLDDPLRSEADQEAAIGVLIRSLLEGDRPLALVRPGRDRDEEEVDPGLSLFKAM